MITSSIVTYKTPQEELQKILFSACNSCIDKIYIIDNSPTNDIKKFIQENFNNSKIEYIFGHGNIGYGLAHNIAIHKAIENKAQYHIVLNPDVEFEPNIIDALTKYMETNEHVGQVMPKVLSPDGRLQYLCKLLPTPMDLIGRRFIPLKKLMKKRNDNFEMRKSEYDKIIEVPYLSGCFMFFRIDALSKIAGFSKKYFMYCEDTDICRRISQAGFKTMYYPYVYITHAHKKESFKSISMLMIHIKSAIIYFNTWGWFFDQYRNTINKIAKQQYCSIQK
ncbi:MAG: glycosyltransferase family 2 protein [Chitinophagaceae bacterium]